MPLSTPDPLEPLSGMVELLTNSNRAVMRAFDRGQLQNNTRFVAYSPAGLSRLVIKALPFVDPHRRVSLDLGCGNGGWTLMAAAAGVPSFGIDISSFLIAHAERNYRLACEREHISSNTPCTFAVGNMYPPSYRDRHKPEPSEHASEADPYQTLGVAIEDAGIIYAYAWRTEMPYLCEFLSETVRPGTILVLPLYGRAGYGAQLRLERLDVSERHFCIGRKL